MYTVTCPLIITGAVSRTLTPRSHFQTLEFVIGTVYCAQHRAAACSVSHAWTADLWIFSCVRYYVLWREHGDVEQAARLRLHGSAAVSQAQMNASDTQVSARLPHEAC